MLGCPMAQSDHTNDKVMGCVGYVTLACHTASTYIAELTVCQQVSDSLAEYRSNGCQIPCMDKRKSLFGNRCQNMKCVNINS